MDADATRMMQDLGLARRDHVSAPEADAKGRTMRDDPRQSRAIMAEFETRRNQAADTSSTEDARAERLRAWNTEATFERDAVTDQLENRFSGQGHRAALSAARQYDKRWEEAENRFGEERRLYLQERAAAGANYIATAPPRSGQNRFRDNVLGATPRSFSGGHGGNAERGRIVSTGAPNPNRAPSPRSFGTVRYAPGGQRPVQPPSGPRATTQPTARATPPAMSAQRRAQPPTGPRPTAQPTARPSTAAAPRAVPAAASPRPCPTSAMSSTSTTTITSGVSTPASTANHSPKEQENFARLAEWYAANPGPECDLYLEKNPDRQTYHRQAYVKFLKTAFRHASDPHGRDAADYLFTYKDREWIMAEAIKAKNFVEMGTEAEMDAYYAAHLEHIDFCKAAKKYFTPKQNSIDAQPATTTPATQPTASAPTSTTQGTIPSPAPAFAATSTSPRVDASPVTLVARSSATAAAVQQSTAAFEARSDIQPSTAVTESHDQRDDASPPASASDSGHSAETTETAVSEPRLGLLGTLSATFYDIVGEYLGVHNKRVGVPAQIHINITSGARRFDPHDLIPQLDALAAMMEGMSSSAAIDARVSASHELEGVRMTDDGLWEEL